MRTVGAAGFLFIGAVAACSSDDPAAPPASVPEGGTAEIDSGGGGSDAAEGGVVIPGEPRRGSRLAPLFRTTADGFDQFAGIVDTMFSNEGCSASRANDGVTRCLPSEVIYIHGELYADSACTTRVADTSSACPKPQFATLSIPGVTSCDTKDAVYDVGAVHSGTLYTKDTGGCVTAPTIAGRTYYVVGAERPATAFVKLTRSTDTIAGELGVDAVDGEDGSHFPQFALIDVGRKRACEPAVAADGMQRCLPVSSASIYSFTDSDCTIPAAHKSGIACDPIYEATTAHMNDPTNADRVRVYTLGAKRANSEVYSKVGMTSCDGPSTVSDDVHDVGAEISATMFPEIGVKTEGGTRIVASRPFAGGKTFPKWGGLQDLQLDARCTVVKASDGKTRCVPEGTPINYSDDQCTQRIVVLSGNQTQKYAVEIDQACPRTFRLFPLAAEITPAPAMRYQNFAGPCVGEPTSAQVKVYAVGAEVEASSFVEMNEVVR